MSHLLAHDPAWDQLKWSEPDFFVIATRSWELTFNFASVVYTISDARWLLFLATAIQLLLQLPNMYYQSVALSSPPMLWIPPIWEGAVQRIKIDSYVSTTFEGMVQGELVVFSNLREGPISNFSSCRELN